jgi:D-alanine-D-alanine ligase
MWLKNAMTNMRIEIISSSLTGLSSMSQESRENISAVLSAHFSDVTITVVNNQADLESLASRDPDLVVLGMKFLPMHPELGFHDPDKIWISDYLEQAGIVHTGSRQPAHVLELSKQKAKDRVKKAGVRTSCYFVASRNQVLSESDITLRYPVFIKPTDRGGGCGVDEHSVASNFDELQAKVQSIAALYGSASLIEEFLPGREFSVTLLKHVESDQYDITPLELVAEPNKRGHRMLSNQVKSSNSESVFIVENGTLKTSLEVLALTSFEALGGRDYGRIDIRLDSYGIPHFLEANLMPSLISGYGTFPKACELGKGLDYEPMILRIVELGLSRQIRDEPMDDPRILFEPAYSA